MLRFFFISPVVIRLLLIAVSLSAFSASANNWLEVKVTGADEALTRNITAHLGELPKSKTQRNAFIFNAEDNIEAALHSLGYYHGQIKQQVLSPEDAPWQLNITVKAGEPTRIQWVDIQLQGEIQNDNAVNQWLNNVAMKPGDILNHGQYEDVKSQLLTLALARGYFDGRYVTNSIVVNRDLNTAKINLHYESGHRYHLGDVNFSGHTLQPGFLDKLVPFQPNAKYSTARLGSLNQQLVNTGYFSNIKVIPQLDKTENETVPVKVELTPKSSHSIELGFGADVGNSDDGGIEPRVRVTWRTPQINSYGHSQETRLEWSPDRPKFLTTYTIPLTHPLDDQLKIRLGLLRDKYGVDQVYDAGKRDYVNTGELESTIYTVGVVRQKRLQSRWILTYSIDALDESYTQSDIDYDPRFLILGSSLSYTHRGDTTLDPKSGYFQYYSLEYADPNTGSDVRLTRLQAKFKWIDTFFDRHRIVARLDIGANIVADEDIAYVPPSLRYFAGGDQSIRGYAYNELGPYIDYVNEDNELARMVVGGRYMLVGSLEYQYYLTPSWRVATFVDAGNAFDIDQIEPIVSVGGGIHWITPIGPIRLDVGVGLKETETVDRSWRIHLTMGSEL
ncbi:autotransporter assembly complex family protein [Shewanella sp. Isolate11]|uniref:autotransporter assembly complex protein TamA n=1 Tax=Shewanella sp. Isolate11 TaxID=2908530 RepID=UPI001EFD11EB|nr:autotransporter assembly complex family protein [Shewanella sp. Isolate11]MCG9696821.1 autotransporter assembly complex protein TamA [Shewanella sp. Isolate11]